METIVPAGPADTDSVRKLSEALFQPYGGFGQLLTRFFSTQGVTTFLAREGEQAVGFVMFGFLPWSHDPADDVWIADLLALGVLPGHQRRGVGQRLLERMLQVSEEMAGWRELREIQLTCAADNHAALAFFGRFGFQVRDRSHGRFSSGQEAWRLARPLTAGRA
ncbi:MAG TPA: GNAT family N-acetyltransferase [Myxococcota bacterium]|nr:GNAT family N-acetyltransferase [Myxococcota bacterium]HRY94404.1 GNAT family N-acetyltransferase [Myxococcota bacterium]HSA22470.1 GNAT family N-acetyltransferase [Myxococcota bacterium]